IADVMGDKVMLIDSGEETARVARQLMHDERLLRDGAAKHPDTHGEHKFYVSDVPEKFSQVATRFLGEVVDNITRVDISRY
ncbi:MAG: glutamate racemase, partial [candidate division Zixibacteria bacterium]|nr:glutamate racemase [candidate division Zixibacteria bacterium]